MTRKYVESLGGPVKDNREILNEAFFKRKTRKELLNLPQYEPKNPKEQGSFLAVTDTDEVKKRLAGTFGVTFGNNSVRSMASKAVKQFPILVSDNVEPETVVMLKKLMEEQYAEYISLLINNQVIDLSDYSVGDETGNIAIQALDTLSGAQFGKGKVANKAASGKIGADDIFGNIPLYSLLRENNQIDIKTFDETVNQLLEDAVIVPAEYTSNLVEFIQNNASEIAQLNEEPTSVKSDGEPTFRKDGKGTELKGKVKLKDYFMMDIEDNDNDITDKVLTRDRNYDIRRGFHGVDDNGNEIYSKLTTADIVVDAKRMNQAINRSVGQILTDPANYEIRSKFEKATFLLQSRRIAGIEYYNYLTLRLGIPVSDNARQNLIKNFKIGDVRDYQHGVDDRDSDLNRTFRLTTDDVRNISENRRLVEPIVRDICKVSFGKAVGSGVLGATVGAGAGAAYAGYVAGATYLAAMSGPLGLGVLAGAVVGSGAYLIAALIKKHRARRTHGKIEGWERVEALINQMEAAQADIRKGNINNTTYKAINDPLGKNIDITKNQKDFVKLSTDVNTADSTDYRESFKTVSSMVDRALREAMDPNFGTFTQPLSEAYIENMDALCKELSEELANDTELKAEMLSEATLYKGTSPMTVKYIEKKPGKDVLLTPSSISTRTNLAYGSTEIERRDNKDRRYDQPLIMTVKFKERFSDGKFADNELTAVIGILGKVIRIPSAEMEYILRENNEGNTLDGFFKSNITNSISDILSGSKISKDLKGMPQSADIWHNLEKVATLAAANKISGRRNNNIANAHIVFSQKEIDAVRNDMDIDYLRDIKKTAALMKRYSALTVMVANDPGQRAYIFDDQENISWNVVPYSALTGKDSGDQLNAALSKLSRL